MDLKVEIIKKCRKAVVRRDWLAEKGGKYLFRA
jgi:hypothetical protein